MANTLQEARTRVKSGALDQYLCLGSHPQPGTLQHPAILFFLFLQLSSSCRTLYPSFAAQAPPHLFSSTISGRQTMVDGTLRIHRPS